jgi:hypothetical protein
MWYWSFLNPRSLYKATGSRAADHNMYLTIIIKSTTTGQVRARRLNRSLSALECTETALCVDLSLSFLHQLVVTNQFKRRSRIVTVRETSSSMGQAQNCSSPQLPLPFPKHDSHHPNSQIEMTSLSSPETIASPSEVIFSCSICQATITEIYQNVDSELGLNTSGHSDQERAVTKLWLTECSHLSCGDHFEGGGTCRSLDPSVKLINTCRGAFPSTGSEAMRAVSIVYIREE